MKKRNKDMTVEEMRKAMNVEIRPAKELKQHVAFPERFNFFMKYGIKKIENRNDKKQK